METAAALKLQYYILLTTTETNEQQATLLVTYWLQYYILLTTTETIALEREPFRMCGFNTTFF